MDERSISGLTRADLARRGFFVIKHEDSITQGIPDMSITRDGITLWVEDKYFDAGAEIKTFVTARSIISKKRYTQLVTCTKLEFHGFAEYWVYQNVKGKAYVGRVSPRLMLHAYNAKDYIEIKNIMERSEWVRQFRMPTITTHG